MGFESSFGIRSAWTGSTLRSSSGQEKTSRTKEQKAAKEQIFNSKEVSMCSMESSIHFFGWGLWNSGGRSVRGEELILVHAEVKLNKHYQVILKAQHQEKQHVSMHPQFLAEAFNILSNELYNLQTQMCAAQNKVGP